MSATVHAYPRKQFFIEMFTRDIGLEDCILDLIDNSMDALLRARRIDVEKEILDQGTGTEKRKAKPARIAISYSAKQFSITDECGGIPYEDAVKEVFCFGHSPDAPKGKLGVYGIGLKRAIFKIGNRIRIQSNTGDEAFRVDIDVAAWALKDDSLEDWTFPVLKLAGPALKAAHGTNISISELHPEVKARLDDGTVAAALQKSISQSYPIFLGEIVDVQINGRTVTKSELPFGSSDDIEPGIAKFTQDGVSVTILATVAPKSKRNQESAGWYVLCNGRVVVAADKTPLTGWGLILPAFHSKYLGFVGLVLFTSDEPAKLPWTTSKRGLNREALVFQHARTRMAAAAKPVITFLNDMYPSDLTENSGERQIADKVVQKSFLPLLSQEPSSFVRREAKVKKRVARVVFDASLSDIAKIQKKLRRPQMSASEIGKMTFNHYLKTECAE